MKAYSHYANDRVFYLLFIVFISLQTSHTAPVLDDGTQALQTYDAGNGCYYNFEHYYEGDRILTNEPCLNCTCHNRMLMCYLRVCPFTKAIGQDCTIEKKPDQCCPVITCPEVPVALLTSSTTQQPPSTSTSLGMPDNYGCYLDKNTFYADGAQVPSDPKKPCELCYCIRNHTACVMQECTLNVEGCKPVYQEGVCCPVRYDCDYEDTDVTTQRSTTLGLITTPGGPSACLHNGNVFRDGEMVVVDRKLACEHCYCMRGDIVCAVQDCGSPLEGTDCTPLETPRGQCCPTSYKCANGTIPINTPEHENQHNENVDNTGDEASVEDLSEEDKPKPVTDKSSESESDESGSTDAVSSTAPTTGEQPDSDSSEEQQTSEKETSPISGIKENTSESPAVQEEDNIQTTEKVEESQTNDNAEASVVNEVKENEPVNQETDETQTKLPANVAEESTSPHIHDEIPENHTPQTLADPETQTNHETLENHTPESEKDPETQPENVQPVNSENVADEGNQNHPLVSNEIPEVTTPESHPTSHSPVTEESARVPGEGSCLVDNQTYPPNSEVPPATNSCHKSCKCVNSIVQCERVDCPLPPNNYINCVPVQATDSCCPTYMCDQKPSDAPEIQNQIGIDKIDTNVNEEGTIAENNHPETPSDNNEHEAAAASHNNEEQAIPGILGIPPENLVPGSDEIPLSPVHTTTDEHNEEASTETATVASDLNNHHENVNEESPIHTLLTDEAAIHGGPVETEENNVNHPVENNLLEGQTEANQDSKPSEEVEPSVDHNSENENEQEVQSVHTTEQEGTHLQETTEVNNQEQDHSQEQPAGTDEVIKNEETPSISETDKPQEENHAEDVTTASVNDNIPEDGKEPDKTHVNDLSEASSHQPDEVGNDSIITTEHPEHVKEDVQPNQEEDLLSENAGDSQDPSATSESTSGKREEQTDSNSAVDIAPSSEVPFEHSESSVTPEDEVSTEKSPEYTEASTNDHHQTVSSEHHETNTDVHQLENQPTPASEEANEIHDNTFDPLVEVGLYGMTEVSLHQEEQELYHNMKGTEGNQISPEESTEINSHGQDTAQHVSSTEDSQKESNIDNINGSGDEPTNEQTEHINFSPEILSPTEQNLHSQPEAPNTESTILFEDHSSHMPTSSPPVTDNGQYFGENAESSPTDKPIVVEEVPAHSNENEEHVATPESNESSTAGETAVDSSSEPAHVPENDNQENQDNVIEPNKTEEVPTAEHQGEGSEDISHVTEGTHTEEVTHLVDETSGEVAHAGEETHASEEIPTVEVTHAEEETHTEEVTHAVDVTPGEVAHAGEETHAGEEIPTVEVTHAEEETHTEEVTHASEETHPVEEIHPSEETHPVEEIHPSEETHPVEEIRPSEETHPVEETHAGEETHPVEETHPAEETHLSEETHPAEESHPTEETHPAEETHAGEETLPAEETHAGEETHPATETHPAEETHPAQETHPAEETNPGEETHPAEETHAGEETHPAEETQAGEENHPSEETHPAEETHAVEETHPVEETHAGGDTPAVEVTHAEEVTHAGEVNHPEEVTHVELHEDTPISSITSDDHRITDEEGHVPQPKPDQSGHYNPSTEGSENDIQYTTETSSRPEHFSEAAVESQTSNENIDSSHAPHYNQDVTSEGHQEASTDNPISNNDLSNSSDIPSSGTETEGNTDDSNVTQGGSDTEPEHHLNTESPKVSDSDSASEHFDIFGESTPIPQHIPSTSGPLGIPVSESNFDHTSSADKKPEPEDSNRNDYTTAVSNEETHTEESINTNEDQHSDENKDKIPINSEEPDETGNSVTTSHSSPEVEDSSSEKPHETAEYHPEPTETQTHTFGEENTSENTSPHSEKQDVTENDVDNESNVHLAEDSNENHPVEESVHHPEETTITGNDEIKESQQTDSSSETPVSPEVISNSEQVPSEEVTNQSPVVSEDSVPGTEVPSNEVVDNNASPSSEHHEDTVNNEATDEESVQEVTTAVPAPAHDEEPSSNVSDDNLNLVQESNTESDSEHVEPHVPQESVTVQPEVPEFDKGNQENIDNIPIQEEHVPEINTIIPAVTDNLETFIDHGEGSSVKHPDADNQVLETTDHSLKGEESVTEHHGEHFTSTPESSYSSPSQPEEPHHHEEHYEVTTSGSDLPLSEVNTNGYDQENAGTQTAGSVSENALEGSGFEESPPAIINVPINNEDQTQPETSDGTTVYDTSSHSTSESSLINEVHEEHHEPDSSNVPSEVYHSENVETTTLSNEQTSPVQISNKPEYEEPLVPEEKPETPIETGVVHEDITEVPIRTPEVVASTESTSEKEPPVQESYTTLAPEVHSEHIPSKPSIPESESHHSEPSPTTGMQTPGPLFPSWTQKPYEHHTTSEAPHLPEEPHYPSGFDQDYEDDDGASYGPGTCRYGGKVYLSAQQIPRDDPCDFCFCFRSDIICLQQSCPPPIKGCYQETIKGFCCPRYECHVSMATMLNITTTTTTTTTTLPPHFFAHAYNGAATKAGCQVKGVAYNVGDRIPSTSGPCLECRCGANGQMKCEPTVCGPQEALLRQVMDAAAVSRR